MKYLKLSGLIVALLLCLVIVSTIILNVVFKDQLIHYAITKLNEQVDARIDIRKADFSVWKKFPAISVELSGVHAQSANSFKSAREFSGTDTLLVANKIYLEFNLFKLFGGKFYLQKLSVHDGLLKLVQDKGIGNFQILKKSDRPSKEEFILTLGNVYFDNINLIYNHLGSSVLINTLVKELTVKGGFNSFGFDVDLTSDLMVRTIQVKLSEYVRNKNMKLDGNLSYKDSVLNVKNGLINHSGLTLIFNGQLVNSNYLNLYANNKGLDLNKLSKVLPSEIQKNLQDFSVRGKSDVNLVLMGKVDDLKIKVDFVLNDVSVTQQVTKIRVKDIRAKGSYSYYKYSTLELKQFSASLQNGTFKGSASLVGLDKPKLNLNVDYSIDLNDVKEFLNLNSLDIFTGKVSGNVVSSATIPGWSAVKLENFSDLKCKGTANLNDVGIKTKGSNYYFEKIAGTILLDNDFYFKNISLFVHDNDFAINGSLSGALEYMFKQRNNVTLEAEMVSKNLDLSRYFVPTQNQSTQQNYSRELLFPHNINLNVKVKVDNFKLNKFSAKNISGYVNYKPTIFVLKSLAFESLSGKVSGNGVILQDFRKNFIVKGQSQIAQVDIQQMFYTFNNFTQNVLEDRHIRGRVSGSVAFSSEWNNALVLNQDKLLVDADLTVFNGQLIKFEPMNGLSRFIALEELQNIKFTTLKNHIQIKDKQIVIPKMDIVSSAFSIAASGTHTFDNHYNYKLRVQLSDVLGRKARKLKKENEEFGEVEDDGLGRTSLPLSVVGYKSDYKIKYDPKMVIADVKDNMKKQGTELKSILNEEFGWFKKDTTLSAPRTEKRGRPKISWDETDIEKPVEKKTVTNKKPADDKSADKPKVEWE